LAAALDEATHEQRLKWMYRLSGRQMKKLFAMAEGNPVHLEDLLDPSGEPVECPGKNGLPVRLFNRFAKVFVRVEGQGLGYNKGPRWYTWFTGPGYYVAQDATEETEGAPGEVHIDYRVLPTTTHSTLPALRSNNRGIARLVFGGMYDLLRRVSRDVYVGDAFRTFPPTAPFLLVRPS
jgi:hypothetical protein